MPRPEPMLDREWAVPFLVDVRLTLAVQGRGRGDPTFQADEAGALWRTSLTPDGPATIRVLPGRSSVPAADLTEPPETATVVRARSSLAA